ncbi:hypothetical protein FA15DRAFT_320815 [Coprinopsis marcescibilis]|uniref:Cyclin N-terminal domain-containing protein n=1 Tax=Coprinopsis marcescibilis TaxID=230819 RepID=A0A5C3L0K4_COPMA|nr:hypothetical protein FA15DRAFT_320815 [Coprinopsis marcescibilis]
MLDCTIPSRMCASTMFTLFGFDDRLPQAEHAFRRHDLRTFVDVILSESQLDTRIALASISLLNRYHLYLNRTMALPDLSHAFFAGFMLAAKIVCPRARVDWRSIGGRVLEGKNVSWLERGFLLDIRWDYDMLEIVQEVWAAYADAKRVKEEAEWEATRRYSKTSSNSSYSCDNMTDDECSQPLQARRPAVPLLHSPLQKSHSAFSRVTSRSSLREAYSRDAPNTDMESIEGCLGLVTSREPQDVPSRTLRKRVSRMFMRGHSQGH